MEHENRSSNSVVDVRQRIATIERLDLEKSTIEDVKTPLGDLLRGMVFKIPVIPPGLTLFRARVFESAQRPEFLSEIAAPPPTKILRAQRCNRAGQSRFYASSSRAATLFECHVKAGQYVALSKWRTTRPLKLNHVAYTPSTFWRMGAERECPPFHPPSQTEAARLITDFLASVFSVDVPEWREKWYKLTTAVTEILTADKNIDGLMYPTIPMSARADNVVLKPESVSMGLAFERVKYELVRKIEGLTVNADVLDYAGTISDSGRLDWKGRQEKWVLKKQGDALRMTVDEHGEYVARDSSGNILEPE